MREQHLYSSDVSTDRASPHVFVAVPMPLNLKEALRCQFGFAWIKFFVSEDL